MSLTRPERLTNDEIEYYLGEVGDLCPPPTQMPEFLRRDWDNYNWKKRRPPGHTGVWLWCSYFRASGVSPMDTYMILSARFQHAWFMVGSNSQFDLWYKCFKEWTTFPDPSWVHW